MTTDTERQFFETFGIEPIGCKDNKNCTGTLDCRTQCLNAKYPQITDRILLELMCIFNQAQKRVYSSIDILESDIDSLKNSVLKWLIWRNKAYKKGNFKQQVQALFEEGN